MALQLNDQNGIAWVTKNAVGASILSPDLRPDVQLYCASVQQLCAYHACCHVHHEMLPEDSTGLANTTPGFSYE